MSLNIHSFIHSFNSRIRCSIDNTITDNDNYIDDVDLGNFMNIISTPDNLNAPIGRRQDRGRVNQHGMKLLDLCKLHNVPILKLQVKTAV